MRLVLIAFSLLFFPHLAGAQADHISELAKANDGGASLGIQKLTPSERAEWNRLLDRIYSAGVDSTKSPASTPSAPANKAPAIPLAPPGASAWITRAEVNGEDIVKLRNGAIFEISSGYVGSGTRDAILIKEGSRWSLWIEGKREFRGQLLKAPDGPPTATLRRSSIQSVTSDGSVIKLIDGTIWEVGFVDRINTGLWLSFGDVLVLNNMSLVNLDQGSDGMIDVRRLK